MSRCQNEFIFEDSDQVGECGSSSPLSSRARSLGAVGFSSPAQSEGSPRGGSEPQGSPVHSTFQTRPVTSSMYPVLQELCPEERLVGPSLPIYVASAD